MKHVITRAYIGFFGSLILANLSEDGFFRTGWSVVSLFLLTIFVIGSINEK